jgi:hypothetical protein
MSILVLGIGTSGTTFSTQSLAVCLVEYDSKDKFFSVLQFNRLSNLEQLLEQFLSRDNIGSYRKINIVFKNNRIAKFFKNKSQKRLPKHCKILSLDLDKNLTFDQTAFYSILIESLSCQYLRLEQLSKSQKEILQRALVDVNDALTQSIMVATCRNPKIYYEQSNA